MKINKNVLAVFSLTQIGVYFLLIESIALARSASFDSVALDMSGPLLLKTLNVLSLIVGFSIIYLTPGLLWIAKKKQNTLPETAVKSVLLSVVLYTLILSALKLVLEIELSRTWMLWTYFGITLAWMGLDRRPFEIRMRREEMRPLLMAGATILFLIILFHGKIFLENFSGDGTENFEFSRSLKTNILPYWDLENDLWGFRPKFMFFAYPNILSILHMGETEASVRLPFFVFLSCIYLVIIDLAKHESDRSKNHISDSLFVGLAISLFVIFNFFYSTWHPYFADIAEPTYVDTMVTFYLLSGILFLSKERPNWFLLCCFFASLSVANGVVLVFLLFLIFFFVEKRRKRIFYLGLTFALIYLAYVGFVAIYEKYYPLGFQRWSLVGMLRYSSWHDWFELNRYFPHIKYLFLMTGVVPVLLFPFVNKKDRLSIEMYLLAGLYALGVFSFRNYNPHYFASVALLFFVPYLRTVASMGGKKAIFLKATYGLVVAVTLGLIFPFRYTVNQDAKALGNRTCIEAAGYRAQVRSAELIYGTFPFKKYGVGHHTLVHYSEKGNCTEGDHDYVLTERKETPDEMEGFIPVDADGLWMREGIKLPTDPRRKNRGNFRYILSDIYARNRR